MSNRIKDLILGLLLGAGIAVPVLMDRGYFRPVPFSYVELVGIENNETTLDLEVTFLKTDECTFDKMAVFGLYLGKWIELDWDVVGGRKGDRLEGYQSMIVIIDKAGHEYTDIEIRTRHYCDGKKQDNVFLEVNLE